MSLDPLFSMTPLNPFVNTYDPGSPDAPRAYGFMRTFGGHTYDLPPYSLQRQFDDGQIILGHDPVAPGDLAIDSMTDDFHRRCCARLQFRGINVATDNQYLLLFALNGIAGATAQFFIGTEAVREEAVSGSEQVAVLLDVPGDGIFVDFIVRLASASSTARLGFQGMDCYLL